MKNGRCRMHGGSTPVGRALPQTTHGLGSKDMPTVLEARFAAHLSDPAILELNRDIALMGAMRSLALERAYAGEGGALLSELSVGKRKVEDARATQNAKAVGDAVNDILATIGRMESGIAATSEVRELTMQRAALVEKEIRRVQLARESLPMRQLDAILGGMIFAERRRADEARDALERGEPASFVIERMLNALHDDHVALFNVREYVASASA